MTTLYLVRHGETVDNAAQIMQGQTPGRLNEKGIEQADLYRSMQTCAIIARPHLGDALSED